MSTQLNSNLSSAIDGKANKNWALVKQGIQGYNSEQLEYNIPNNIATIASEYMLYVGFANGPQIYGGTSLIFCQHVSHPCYADIIRSSTIRYTVFAFLDFLGTNIIKQFRFTCVYYDSSHFDLGYALFYR